MSSVSPVAYSAITMRVVTTTNIAIARPAQIRPGDGVPDCARIATASPANHRAARVIGGQAGWIHVSTSTPVAQPSQSRIDKNGTAAAASWPARTRTAATR